MATPELADAKALALRQSRTLHPRAARVQDPLFCTYAFFDARDLIQVKYEMLRRVGCDGLSITRAAADFGLSRPSYYQAKTAFEAHGRQGLVPAPRRPKPAQKLTDEMLAFLQARRVHEPRLKVKALADELECRFGLRVHPRTIARRLQKKPPAQLPLRVLYPRRTNR